MQADQVTESLMHTQQQKSLLEKKVSELEQVIIYRVASNWSGNSMEGASCCKSRAASKQHYYTVFISIAVHAGGSKLKYHG